MRLIDPADGSLFWRSSSNVIADIAKGVVIETGLYTSLSEDLIADRAARSVHVMAGSALVRCPTDDMNMDAPERKALGAPGRAKMDRQFWDALSDKGRHDPVAAADIVYHRTLSALHAFESLVKFREMSIQECRLSASGSSRQCAAAGRYNGQVFSVAGVTNWPIDECDAPWCTCLLQAKFL